MSMFAALTQSMRAGVRTLLPPVTNVAMCAPAQGFFSLFPLQVREYRVRTAIKRRCDSCQIVRRKGRLYVICKREGRHKQRQG
eukprot:m.75944 g.75944  ORF g.75944 m.75944 type:complete len:83 (-) comp50424_c0_seq1:73-321(-)